MKVKVYPAVCSGAVRVPPSKSLAHRALLCAGLAGGQLVQLQLVNGEDYIRQSAYWLTTTSTVSAARGEILDRYGRPMVTNKTEFSLVLV